MLGGAHTLPGQLALIHHVSKLWLITRMILWPGGRVEPGWSQGDTVHESSAYTG